MDLITVRKDSYYDSVVLMLVSREVKARPDIEDAVVGMATEMNVRLIQEMGYHDAAFDSVSPGDLIIAVRADKPDQAEAALLAVDDILTRDVKNKSGAQGNGDTRNTARSLASAYEMVPEANMVVISVPGAFAAREARMALETGMHVMLFSDNVSLDDEIALKTYARDHDLLLMGPDCGTAIINGVPLCFANVVRSGSIGLAAASGTGLQEVTCLIDRFGGGITQAIGTGGRDLKNERVGGLTMITAIEALARDDETKVITVISKPPAKAVEYAVIDALKKTGKPSVAHFIGSPVQAQDGNVRFAADLEEAAVFAVEAAGVKVDIGAETDTQQIAQAEAGHFSNQQKYLRGLFTGGTLADEALFLLNAPLSGVFSNNQLDESLILDNPRISQKHCVVDLGDDTFTSGAPHPMIDPAARAERLVEEANDPETAVVLMDFVLGYGSHPDPAGAMAESIRQAKSIAESRGGYLSVVASVTGTALDYQNLEKQRATLRDLGCIVAQSNVRASVIALEILKARGIA